MTISKKTDLKRRLFAVQVTFDKRLKAGYKTENIFEVQMVPEISQENILYYIELFPLNSQKSLFNNTLFYDYKLFLWARKEVEYDLTSNNWNLVFTWLPKGLGEGALRFEIVDKNGNKLNIHSRGDSRNAFILCQVIEKWIYKFHKMSFGNSLEQIIRKL